MISRQSRITPGEILQEEFLKPLGISQNQLASSLHISPGRVNDIIHARRSITPDSAARLTIFFGTSPDFWLNLQARHDGKLARRELVPAIAKHVREHAPHAA